jgi:uncharacterized membrane protein YidH (DUF202 family)
MRTIHHHSSGKKSLVAGLLLLLGVVALPVFAQSSSGDPADFRSGLDQVKSVAEQNELGEARSAKEIILTIVKWLLSLVGTIAVISLVYGGFLYVSSQGDERKVDQAKHIILYSCIGLIIIGLSGVLVNVVISIVQ